jgi:hypothetical protein
LSSVPLHLIRTQNLGSETWEGNTWSYFDVNIADATEGQNIDVNIGWAA